ncbi:acyl-CoA N-acyltransferase [Mucor lusitanicus]
MTTTTKRTRQHAQVDYTLGMCLLCKGFLDFDQDGNKRDLLKCSDCHQNAHAICCEMNSTSAEIVKTYDWQCNDCKSCLVCQSKNDEDKIVICNHCDRGYHTFCCDPPLKHIPKDDWYCKHSLGQFIESITLPKTIMTKDTPKRKSIKRKASSHLQDENHNRMAADPGRPKVNTKALEEEELFYKTFGNKLTKAEADTIRGTPNETDIAHLKWQKQKQSGSKCSQSLIPAQRPSKWEPVLDVPKIRQISFNDYLIDTWYVAPYPEEYSQNSTLYICEYCMKYMKSSFIANRHQLKCKVRHPPGDEIYRDGNISIFEVDGRKNKIYCQNLCLMAKMFLDHKTLYYDVEPFLFYIMTESDERGCHFVGYFSKEKRSSMNYNVSCILTMPIFQRKGYGQFLIDFSYLLSKRESKTGSPERPLSDLGLLSYRSYWKNVLFRALEDKEGYISIDDLSSSTSLTPDDIVSTLQNNNMIRHDKVKGEYSIVVNPQAIKDHLANLRKKDYARVNPEKLTWTPFVLSKDRLAALLGQTKVTIKNVDESTDVDVD